MAAAALPQFPPGHIPFDELIPGTIYKCVVIEAGYYGWGFARFIRSENILYGLNFSRYGTWITNPNPALAAPLYKEFGRSDNVMKYYPLKFETGAIPRLPRDVNPPPAELMAQITNAAKERRARALEAWIKARPSNNDARRRTNRRRRSSRRSIRRR